MKVQIRQGVFETNSSSTHVLCVFNKEDWDKFVKARSTEEILLDWWNYKDRKFINSEDLRLKFEEFCKSGKIEPTEENFENWIEEKIEEEEYYDYDTLSERYEILTETVPNSSYIAVSIWGYE